MKVRGSDKEAQKIEPQMAPMIDVVFQLLIFFMLTLKIIEPEGNFSVNMPLGAPTDAPADVNIPPIKIRLIANDAGQLVSLQLDQTKLGNDDAAFDKLNAMVRRMIDEAGGYSGELEAEIDADHGVHWRYTMKAVSAVRGTIDNSTSPPSIIPYIEKIKFAQPREPDAAG